MLTLSTLPTFNIYAEPQDSGIEPILVGEFKFDLGFLQDYFPYVIANDSVPVVSLSSDLDTVNEGEQLALNLDLSQPVPAGGLTVELKLIEGSDSIAEGFEFLPDASSNITNLEFITEGGEVTGAEVTLAEGTTEAAIVSQIVADGVTEGDESVSLGLVDGDDYNVTGDVVNFTIIDTSTGYDTSLPVVGLSTDIDTVNEGEQLALKLDLLQPLPAGGLTVELKLIEGSDSIAEGFEFLPDASSNITNLEFITEGGEVTGAEVTLAEGVTDASIVSEIVADGVTEGDETVSLGLVDGDAYNVTGDAVNFTIIDTSTDINDAFIEVEDVPVPFLGDVDFAVNIDYIDEIKQSKFVSETEIADSIDRFLVAELNDTNISELQVQELTEFIIDDSHLGISSLSDSVTVELSIEPNSLIPNPIEVSSTILVSEI